MQELQPQIRSCAKSTRPTAASCRRKYETPARRFNRSPVPADAAAVPVFISLYHVLRHLANSAHRPPGDPRLTLYGFTEAETYSAARAKLFGAPLASSFHDSAAKIISLGGSVTATRVVTIILVIVSAAATYFTQRQAMRNAPTLAEGTAALIQRSMLYLIPFFVLTSGFIFPLGVLIYWFSGNPGQWDNSSIFTSTTRMSPRHGHRWCERNHQHGQRCAEAGARAKPIRPAKPTNSNNSNTQNRRYPRLPLIRHCHRTARAAHRDQGRVPRIGASQSRKKRR